MTKRPVNLNLLTIRFPLTAIVSILHRASGCILFLIIPVFLGLLSISLKSPEGFYVVHNYLTQPIIKVLILGFLFALSYHLLAGIRHLMMDSGVGEALKFARLTAWLVLGLAFIFTVMMGIHLW